MINERLPIKEKVINHRGAIGFDHYLSPKNGLQP